MTNSPVCGLQMLIEQTYERWRDFHGNLGITNETYSSQVLLVLKKHGKDCREDGLAQEFFNQLHAGDLYLAIACAMSSNLAWQRFQTLYQRSVYDAAWYVCQHRSAADELAQSVMGHLFLPDTSGNSRMASFDGQVSLVNWLWAVIAYQSINERKLKFHAREPLESLSERGDNATVQQIASAVRANRYGVIIEETLREASAVLSKKERTILGWYYEDRLGTAEIAELFETCKSNVSYHLKQARNRLRQEILSILRNQYRLSEEAIKECVEEILENPGYSLLTFIKVNP
jgi:RNA polymerase sigma-70 factor, ECF subfamily